VGGADDGGAGGAVSGLGAGCVGAGCGIEGGCAAGGSLSIAGAPGAGPRGTESTGGGVIDGGAGTPAAVLGGVLTSDCAGSSPILSTAVTEPNPTSSAATHARGTITARFPITRLRGSGWVDGSPTEFVRRVAPGACTDPGFRMQRGA
jgi:hypothetical protein